MVQLLTFHRRILISKLQTEDGTTRRLIRRFSRPQYKTFSSYRRVRIGNVEIPLGSTDGCDEEFLVPSRYLSNHERPKLAVNELAAILPSHSPTILKHLQWMMAKDSLQQDMLLIGPPGAGEVFRRRLALAYAEMTNKAIEILPISGDLTESDLKQRREIVQKGTIDGANPIYSTEIQFVDQAPVRAAKKGRILILDGIEKAERNVLPTLNNLLENREMHLEDGTMLLPSHRLEELSLSPQQDNDLPLSSSFLKPVHSDFRVIALGVPSPPFAGRSLDPPLRSRFQIRRIDNQTSEELYEQILTTTNNIDNHEDVELAKSCAILAGGMNGNEESFPSHRLNSLWKLMRDFPFESRRSIIQRACPTIDNGAIDEDLFEDFKSTFDRNCKESKIIDRDHHISRYIIKSITQSHEESSRAKVTLMLDPELHLAETQDTCTSKYTTIGSHLNILESLPHAVYTSSFRNSLAAMIQEHSVGNDILLVSQKGEGKTILAQEFAARLGYETHLFAMNTETTSQNLLQRRSTDPSTGETRWEDSPLMRAARRGDICVLDGIEKLRPDVLSSIQSLIVDRDIQLPDGQRALRQDRIDTRNQTVGGAAIAVHPSFRVIALASSSRGDDGMRCVTPNVTALFSTIHLHAQSKDSLRAILKGQASSEASYAAIDILMKLRDRITSSVAEECGIAPLSTRNMIRVVRMMGPQSNLLGVLSSVFLFDLLPLRQRHALEAIFDRIGISQSQQSDQISSDSESMIVIEENKATIGSLVIQRGTPTRPEMVPSPRAFDIPTHTQIIQELLLNWKNGERSFLLLGNQGVGKNKIVDRICEIANWEREYIQLHRDSTIGQLTSTLQLEKGKIVLKNSPLIRAVRDGCVLVVDEADKAPVEVVSVLKGLVEDGDLLLADGRRICREGVRSRSDVITIHPNFSLWVLANRPGFPFLGNDFFQEIGDCFTTIVVKNPDLDSESRLLAMYAPNLDQDIIRAIASSFSDLRLLSDNNDLTYPYSTREAIAVIRHLQKYPEDGLDVALQNILDFDSYDIQTYKLLRETFRKNGIEISRSWSGEEGSAANKYDGESQQNISIEYLGSTSRADDGESLHPPKNSSPKFGKWDDNNDIHVGGNQWAGGTGGSDTAGLGGRGGPYRLDRGHRVHQVSDKAKDEVSASAKLAAKQMAKKALEEKLKRIGMGEEEFNMYKDFSANIQRDVSRLKGILAAVNLRSKERGWIKHQSYGEIDDAKIVDGITGDKYIYKRRGNIEEASFPKEKYLRFVMDVSGSMYRFNGYDQRLIRCLEASLLVMESFQLEVGEAKKFDYSIVGHSGDSSCIPFVDWASSPNNEKERLQILQTMLAHSQYCMSGDNTLEALEKAIDEVSAKAVGTDDGYVISDTNSGESGTVICLSDANLARYGIDPRELGNIIERGRQKNVNAYIIFIASFGEEAESITRALPAGSGYICMETNELPKAVREILASGVLK